MKAIEEVDEATKKDNIIDEIMKSKGLYCLVSNAKVGKSMLSLQLSNAIANGTEFLGHNTISSPILYISTESDFGQIQDRIMLILFRIFTISLVKISPNICCIISHGKEIFLYA